MRYYLMKTKYELVVEQIERIEEGLVWKLRFEEYERDFSAESAIAKYLEIKENLENIPDLSKDEKSRLQELLEVKIKEAPEKDKQANQKYENIKKEHESNNEKIKQAWERAKERYSKQSIFKKVLHTFGKTRPKDYERFFRYPHLLDLSDYSYYESCEDRVENLNKMYGGDYDR